MVELWCNYLGGEASVADDAFEGTLFGVAAVVDLQSRVAGERLEANVARRVAAPLKWNFNSFQSIKTNLNQFNRLKCAAVEFN